MPISITIEGNNPQEVKELVLDLASVIEGVSAKDFPVDTKVSTVEMDKPKQKKPEKAIEPEVIESDTETEEEPADIPTIEEIRAKAQELGPSKKAEIKGILNEFGVKNLGAIPEEKRGEFMARLEELE